jgi:hypothetical protein
MWTEAAPVQRSRSMITGRRYVSRFGRARVQAALDVSALAKSRSGAGYSEMLIRYLDGGANLVRLSSYPINWHLDAQAMAASRASDPLQWTSAGQTLNWQNGGAPLLWFSGAILTGVAAGSQLTVTGLPPDTLVARPGEFVKVFVNATDVDGLVAQVTAEARSDAAGVAVLRLFAPLPAGDYPRLNIGASESRVFEVTDMPSAMQPVGRNWSYSWRFREVFADECGGFNEVDPWN